MRKMQRKTMNLHTLQLFSLNLTMLHSDVKQNLLLVTNVSRQLIVREVRTMKSALSTVIH